MDAEGTGPTNTPAAGHNAVVEDFMQPVALLVDQLRSDDTTCRVEATKKISTIALALGPERTRTEFISFVESTGLSTGSTALNVPFAD